MAYDPSVYSKVTTQYAERRQLSRAERERRQAEVYAQIPALQALDTEMAQTAISVARAVLSGDSAGLLEGLRLRGEQITAERERMLTEAGWPANYLQTPYVCPICKDEGNVDAHICECMRRALREEAARRLDAFTGGGRVGFESFSLDYYSDVRDPRTGIVPRAKMEEVLRFCKQYAQNFTTQSPSIYFSGGTGLGKTHLSLAIAYAVSDRGFGVEYGSVADLIGAVEREHFSRDSSREALDRMLGCDLLILDDLGAEFSTSFTVASLYNLFNTRLQRGLPVIISTNLSGRELTERYGERFTSRVSGCCAMFGFVGVDIRQQKRRNGR